MSEDLTQFNQQSAYHNCFFLLRVPFSINGNHAQIGHNEGMLTLNSSSRDPSFGITFDSLYKDVSTAVKKYGIKVTNSWCEDTPLFEIKYSTPDGMKNFVHSAKVVQSELESRISAHLTERRTTSVSSTTRQCPSVAVRIDIFLLTPDPVSKDADLVLVTPDSLSTCLIQWKNSEIFSFGALFSKHSVPRSVETTPTPLPEKVVAKKKELIEEHNAMKLAMSRRNEVEKKVEEAQANVEELVKKSNDIREELKKKQHELELFQKLQEHKDEEVQAVIDSKNKEIQQLQQELKGIQKQLLSMKEGKLVVELQRQHEKEMEEIQEQHKKKKEQLAKKEEELRKMKEQHQKEKEKFEGLINEKKEEITKTQKEAKNNEAKLKSEKEKADLYQKEFDHANKELTEKSVRVQYLEEAKQKLETQLEEERRKYHEIAMKAFNASPSRCQQGEVSGPGKDTWEYKVFTKNSAEIIKKLATVKLARRVADELNAASIIGQDVRERAYNTGPDVVESGRVRPMITALQDQIQQNPLRYHQFRSILLSLGTDAETAIHYMPEQGHMHATEEQKMTIQWQACKDTPMPMQRGNAVTHDRMIYINPNKSDQVYEFDAEEDHWTALPNSPYHLSALVVVNRQLTTVGGKGNGGATNSLLSLTEEGKDRKWVEIFPQMPTSRYNLAAVCRGRTLITAGGRDGNWKILSTVEILDTESLKWTSVSSLPHPTYMASITVCGDQLYLLGGYNESDSHTHSVFTCSMSDLLQTLPVDAQVANQLTVWHQATDAPYYWSTAISVGEVLLAIGGNTGSSASSQISNIFSYDPISKSWQDKGHMNTPRERSLVALLPSNELIVAGGYGGNYKVEKGKIVA